MAKIQLLPWEAAREQATRIRFAVFVEEQRVPPELEMDDEDASSLHALAFTGGQAVATGRLLRDGHIGRMAVMRHWRRQGIGGLILEALVDEAGKRGLDYAVLAAQVHAMPFYRAHGFSPTGGVYQEAGIPHQDMRRPLQPR